MGKFAEGSAGKTVFPDVSEIVGCFQAAGKLIKNAWCTAAVTKERYAGNDFIDAERRQA